MKKTTADPPLLRQRGGTPLVRLRRRGYGREEIQEGRTHTE